MKKLTITILALLLASCVPEPQPIPKTTLEEREGKKVVVRAQEPFEIPPVYSRVWQNEKTLWGFDDQTRLVLYNSSEKTVVFKYDNEGRLDSIRTPNKKYDVLYGKHGPLKVVLDDKTVHSFRYNSIGQLVGWESGQERFSFTYDSKGRLSSYFRDKGQMTEFVYDQKNRTSKILRGRLETSVRRDDRDRLGMLVRQDDYWVFGYWRENLLSSMSGPLYGLKETVNYGPASIKIVSNIGQTVFESETFKPRLSALNLYLFCTRWRKIPVLFEWASWVILNEYQNGTVQDYVTNTLLCEAIS